MEPKKYYMVFYDGDPGLHLYTRLQDAKVRVTNGLKYNNAYGWNVKFEIKEVELVFKEVDGLKQP